MTKKVSLKITDETYKNLVSLAGSHKENVEDVIAGILDVVGMFEYQITELGKEYKVPRTRKPDSVVLTLFDAGFHSLQALFNEVLEKLEVKGCYVLADIDVDLDKSYMFFYYTALRGCKLQIDSFAITLEPGIVTLSTSSLIEAAKIDAKALRKLKKIIKDAELPVDMENYLEDYNIEIQEEEFWDLKIDCTAESLGCLPSVKGMSKFVKQIFKKAGIRNQI